MTVKRSARWWRLLPRSAASDVNATSRSRRPAPGISQLLGMAGGINPRALPDWRRSKVYVAAGFGLGMRICADPDLGYFRAATLAVAFRRQLSAAAAPSPAPASDHGEAGHHAHGQPHERAVPWQGGCR